MSDSNKPTLRDVQSEILHVSRALEVDPIHLSRDKFLANTDRITRTDLNRYGQYAAIKEDFLAEDKDLKESRGLELRLNTSRKQHRQLGEVAYLVESYTKGIQNAMRDIPVTLSKKPAALINSARPEYAGVAFISDNHFGINVDEEEMGGMAKLNWKIAARRMAMYIEEVCRRVPAEQRAKMTLWLAFGGDHTQGVIHRISQDNVDLMVNQMRGAVQIFTSLIDFARTQFKQVYAPFVPGNHMRFPYKGSGRALDAKYDGFHTIMAEWLAANFRTCDDVTFSIPKTPFSVFKVWGHTYYMTHGDSTFNIGSSPRTSINIKTLRSAANNVTLSPACNGKLDVVMLGHYHRATRVELDHGTELIVNGTTSGLTPFMMNACSDLMDTPSQTFWLSRKDEAVCAFDVIRLKNADTKSKYDAIIPLPKL